MNRKDVMYYAGMSILSILFLALLAIGYLTVIDGNNVIKYNGPMKVVAQTNDSITVQLDYCKTKLIPALVYLSYEDGIIYTLPPKASASLPIGCNKVNKVYDMPRQLPNGKYKLVVDTELKVNFLRSITKRWETELFFINRTQGGK